MIKTINDVIKYMKNNWGVDETDEIAVFLKSYEQELLDAESEIESLEDLIDDLYVEIEELNAELAGEDC